MKKRLALSILVLTLTFAWIYITASSIPDQTADRTPNFASGNVERSDIFKTHFNNVDSILKR